MLHMQGAPSMSATPISPAHADSRAAAAWPVVAACALAAAGWGFYQSLPVVLGALAQRRGFSDQQVGWLGSAELSGMLLGGVFAAWVVAVGRHRRLAACGLMVVLAALVATALQQEFPGTGMARVVGGFGAGMTYSICVACLAATAFPTRNFGILNAAMVVFGAVQLAAFPWLNTQLGLNSILLVLALECAVAALLLPVLPVPVRAMVSSPAAVVSSGRIGRTGVGYLAATALFHIAPAIFWTYCERLGTDEGMRAELVGATLTVISLAAAGVCLLAWRIARRWGERRALIVAGALMALSLLSWASPAGGSVGYVLRALLFFLTWGTAGVFQQSEARLFDSTGRMTTLVPVAQGLGLAVGPFIGATILAWGFALPGMVALSGSFVVVSLALYAVAPFTAPSIDRERR